MNRICVWAWFPIFVILLLQIYGIKAACYWSGGAVVEKKCNINCINVTPEEINESLEKLSNDTEKEECRNAGIYLNLQSNYYPKNTLESKWFTADVKVVKMDILLRDRDVENDAFLSNAFQTVKELKISNLGVNVIRNGTFNGLKDLEILIIDSVGGIGGIENGVLDSLAELKEFKFIQSLNNQQINIKGFTGSKQLTKLEVVQIKYNLSISIVDTTFVGLTNVKTLDLSSCQIVSIGSNSFQPFRNSIQEIDLRSNRLVTIPSGLFNILPKSGLTIDINANRFHCDCDLIYLRSILEQFESNFKTSESIACTTLESTLEGCMTKNVLQSECFDGCERPPITQSTTEPSTTEQQTTPTTTTTAPDKYFTKECYKPNESEATEEVFVKEPSTYMTITETKSGEVNLNIDSQYSSSVVIWFSENQETVEDINCISQGERTSIPITELRDNVVYSFCLMDKTKSIVSPLDCISYMKRDSAWLLESSKTLTVTLIVISLMLSALFGIGIGFWILNYNPFAKDENGTTSQMPIQSKTPASNVIYRNSNIFNRKVSNITNSTEYTTRTTLQYDTSTYIAPPLPERPSNMRIYEEPTYATVEEMFKDK